MTVANLQRLRTAPGLTEEPYCVHLAELAQDVPGSQAIVEIGVFKGRTLCYLAYGARHGNEPMVYGIDPWDLPGERPPSRLRFTASATRRAAEQTVRQQGMRAHVTLIRGFSTEVAKTWPGPSVGLLHVDGAHDYDAVVADVRAWGPHLAGEAVIVFDDYGNDKNPDVKQAVDDLVTEGVLELTEVVGDWQAVAKLAEGYTLGDEPAADVERVGEPEQSVDLIPAEVALEAEPLEGAQPEPSAEEPKILDDHPGRQIVPEPDESIQAMQAHDEAKQPQIEPPPHSGAGSGTEAWRAYAHEVTDLDGTVLAEMNRAEIIAILEERNIPT
jgi:hypothetical protein